jgi:hypothetical protein
MTGGWLHSGAKLYGTMPNCIVHPDGPTTMSPESVYVPGQFETARKAYLAAHPRRSATREKWYGAYRRLNPLGARKR